MKFLLLPLILIYSSICWAALAVQDSPDESDSSSIYEQPLENLTPKSDIYGSWLFDGGFKKVSFSGVNPKYRISQGDTLLVQLWGGLSSQEEKVVDAQGNIFIPRVGPVKVEGVTNNDINNVILKSIKRIYKSNVEAYVTLVSSQTVKVFVSGLVNKPGLYEGQSADSILRFLDQAGGIRPELGSYRHIYLKRSGKIISQIDLYNFISQGNMPILQLHDGDVVFVDRQIGYITISGEVGFTGRYELKESHTSLTEVIRAAVVTDKATHITLVEPEGTKVNARQFSINELGDNQIQPGAQIKVSSQLRPTNISVEIQGEHNSRTELVLPWGSNLADLLKKITYTPLSNKNAVQLFRKDIARRQKNMLMTSLVALEQSVLTARSSTREEAELRKSEASTVMQWIQRAKQVEPRGQVILSDGYNPNEITLQQGDTVVIPSKKNLVLVHGEVLFPTAIAYKKSFSAKRYIQHAGGSNGDLDDMNTLVMKPNGVFVNISDDLRDEDQIGPGDEIFVLAKPDFKSLQLTKDISQVIYQVAVSAAVVLAL